MIVLAHLCSVHLSLRPNEAKASYPGCCLVTNSISEQFSFGVFNSSSSFSNAVSQKQNIVSGSGKSGLPIRQRSIVPTLVFLLRLFSHYFSMTFDQSQELRFISYDRRDLVHQTLLLWVP